MLEIELSVFIKDSKLLIYGKNIIVKPEIYKAIIEGIKLSFPIE